MSRISFMRAFPWGEATYFKEKIWKGLHIPHKYDWYDGHRLFPMDIENRGYCGMEPKIHTIRKSPFLQKYVGKPVTLFHWSGKPYRSPHHPFADVVLHSFQRFEYKVEELPDKLKDKPGVTGNSVTIRVDGCALDYETAQQLAINDGLDLHQMLKYFKGDFTGYIYHWTNLRY